MNKVRAVLVKEMRSSSEGLRNLLDDVRGGPPLPSTDLETVRRRLELLVAAMYGRPIRIEAAPRPGSPGIVSRIVNRASRSHRAHELSQSDAHTIRLPAIMRDSRVLGPADIQYRLLAIEHAERIMRGTAALVSPEQDPLERDLYLLAEASAVDGAIARNMSGMPDAIRRARRRDLERRPSLASLGPMEQEVEKLTQRVLSSAPGEMPEDIPEASAADSLKWAREMAKIIRSRCAGSAKRYRGVVPTSLWGTVVSNASAGDERSAEQRMQDALNSASTLDTHVEQEGGAGRPSPDASGSDASMDEGTGDASTSEDAADDGSAAAQLAEAGAGTAPDDGSDAFPPETDPSPDLDAALRAAAIRAQTPIPPTIAHSYPEWDCNAKAYRLPGATVRIVPQADTNARLADEILAEHASIVRSLRQRFEKLRARRVQLPRQRDGDELDLAACVRALVDVRTGHASDDRLYIDVRPARRPLAITILVDTSGSTAQPIVDDRRVIDVERTALLLASEALDALGDRYSILTFSSHGEHDVRVGQVKDFAERNGERVRERITAMEPQGKTRLGAAIRHASAQLGRQAVSHRLLLILSDGKPNDTDRYFSHYAAEDTRQAVLEARASGVYPFCLTVDREEGSEYLAHIFGQAGHVILRNAAQLPAALVKGVEQLLAS